jgi:lipoprotein-anchoring transpeptidase ErfK/SrfK
MRARIGVGRSLSPTPTGRYFVTELLRPPDPHGFYGPYAFGLSAYSPVYTSFAGGDGQVGIHGTSAPASIGHDVSHGCIRVANAVVARLARRLPLGTPVTIAR